MKTKEISCIHYQCEGSCDLGREAKFYGLCQHCKTYRAIPGGRPARLDTRRQRIEREERKYDYDYGWEN